MKIIGISGKLKSGKDLFADFCEAEIFEAEKFHDKYLRICLADPIKQSVADILGIDVALLYDQGFKESEMPTEWKRWVKKSTGEVLDPNKKFDPDNIQAEFLPMTYRMFLQEFGTNLRKTVHPDIWVNSLFNHVEQPRPIPLSYIVIPDVRFPNEADNILSRGGTVHRINRSEENRKISNYSWEELNHESETALDDYDKFTSVYQNDGSIGDLKNHAKKIFKDV